MWVNSSCMESSGGSLCLFSPGLDSEFRLLLLVVGRGGCAMGCTSRVGDISKFGLGVGHT